MLEVVGVIAAFCLLVILVNKKYPLAVAMFGAAGVLALTSEKQISYLLGEALKAAVARDTLELVAVVTLIGILSRTMDKYGLLEQMSSSLALSMKSVKPAISIIPAIIGAMPVLGGAVISAPMVDRLGDRLELTPKRKAAANMVFRHGIFFVFPFSPSLLLAAKLSGFEIGALIKVLWPFSAVLWSMGYLLYLRRAIECPSDYDPEYRWVNARKFLVATSPILLSIALGMGVRLPLPIALLFGIGLAMYLGRNHPDFSLLRILKGIDYKMAAAMVGIMVFKTMIQNLGFITKIIGAIGNAGVPLAVVFCVLPLLVGLTSASQQTTVAITFPLLLPFVPAAEAKVAYVMLMHVSSFLAYFMSPMHMCALLTNEYFKVKVSESFGEAKWILVALAALAGAMFFVLR